MAFCTTRSLLIRRFPAKPFSALRFLFLLGVVPLIVAATGQVSLGQPASQPVVKKISTQLRGFGVPFKIDAEDRSYIEVQLFVTTDQGKTWQLHSRQSTDAAEFPFQADDDGEYWFALRTLTRDHKLIPEGQIQPELQIVVDTVKPTLTFNIDSDAAGRVICSWDARDVNLDANSLRIFYRELADPEAGDDATWQQVPINTSLTRQPGVLRDRVAWWPKSSGTTLQVKVEVSDEAGNQVTEERVVSVPMVAWRNKSSATANVADTLPRKIPPPQSNVGNERNSLITPAESLAREIRLSEPGPTCEGGVCNLQPGRPPAPNSFVAQPSSARIGSEEVWEAPPPPIDENTPVPDQIVKSQITATNQPAQKSQPLAANRSVPWESEPVQPTAQQNSFLASTLGSGTRGSPPSDPTPDTRGPTSPSELVAQSVIRESASGKTIFESTATRKRNPQPLAQFATKSEWQGRAGVPPHATANSPASPSENWTPDKIQTPPPAANKPLVNSNLVNQPVAATGRIPNHRPEFPAPTFSGTQAVSFGGMEPAPRSPNLFGPEIESLQSISSKRFQLDYGIDAIDPSGVQKVVLWMTRDRGLTWTSWSTDPDGVSPFPVEVDESGIFGFRIVVQSKDGLTGVTPRRGDKPDVYLNVDDEAPLAQITSVPYGRGDEAGRLVINWKVTDPYLTLRPITLSYSPSPQGPWSIIETGIRNEGRYVWKVEPDVPEKVYLKLEAVDQAGNVGVFQLQQMIDISGLVPRGRIRGIRAVSN